MYDKAEFEVDAKEIVKDKNGINFKARASAKRKGSASAVALYGSKWWAEKVRHEMTFKRNQCLTDMILTFQILIVRLTNIT